MVDFVCVDWNGGEPTEGKHGVVGKARVSDAYFHAGGISRHMDAGQLSERDLEGVEFVVRAPGENEEVSAELVESNSASYLEKFGKDRLYKAVAEYVLEMEACNAELTCPECGGDGALMFVENF